MTGRVEAREREQYSNLWQSVSRYGDHAPGEGYVDLFMAMSGAQSGTVLDAGCGSGKGAIALDARGFDVAMTDLTGDGLTEEAAGLSAFAPSCLWRPIADQLGSPYRTFDWVYCCDVLEHVPTEYTLLTIARLLEVARQGVFLSIALVPDHFGLWVGKPLHQTVQPFTWWRDRIRGIGRLIECRDLLMTGLYLVEGQAAR